jgi:acyl-CoA dehydrogenase
VREIQAACASDETQAVRDFDAATCGHVSYTLSNVVRVFTFGLTGAYGIVINADQPMRRYFQRLTRYSAILGLLADVVMLAENGLGRSSRLRAGLDDALSQMVLCCAVIRRFDVEGRQKEDLPLLRWVMQDALSRVEADLDGVLRAFPWPPTQWLLRALIFPLGRHARPPSVQLSGKVAALLTAPCAARDRLTAGVYAAQAEEDPSAALEVVLQNMQECEMLQVRMNMGDQGGKPPAADWLARIAEARDAGVINAEEAALLERDHALRRKASVVDAFEPKKTTRANAQG